MNAVLNADYHHIRRTKKQPVTLCSEKNWTQT